MVITVHATCKMLITKKLPCMQVLLEVHALHSLDNIGGAYIEHALPAPTCMHLPHRLYYRFARLWLQLMYYHMHLHIDL